MEHPLYSLFHLPRSQPLGGALHSAAEDPLAHRTMRHAHSFQRSSDGQTRKSSITQPPECAALQPVFILGKCPGARRSRPGPWVAAPQGLEDSQRLSAGFLQGGSGRATQRAAAAAAAGASVPLESQQLTVRRQN